MPLDVRFRLEKTDLRVQESPAGTLDLVNIGRNPIEIARPGFTESLPVYRVVEVGTRAETFHRKPGRGGPPKWTRTLEAGESEGTTVDFPQEVPLSIPGNYEISAIYGYEEEGRQAEAESEPIRIRIRASSPRHLSLDSIQGYVAFGAWLGLGGEAPELLLGHFRFVPGGGVRVVAQVGSADLHARPVLSFYPNQTFADAQWVAWIEGAAFHCAHFDPKLGVQAVPKLDLSGPAIEIAPPIHSDPPRGEGVRPAGSALLWTGDRRSGEGRLQVVRLLSSQPNLGPARISACPAWMSNHVFSKGSRCVLFAHEEAQTVKLSRVGWTDSSIDPAIALQEWKGEFLGAGATLDPEDVIRASLLVKGADGVLRLESVEVDRQGAYRAVKSEEYRHEDPQSIRRAIVRTSATGTSCAALLDDRERWFLALAGKLGPLPAAVSKAGGPLELAFLADRYPVLILGSEGRGLRLVMPDGSELPPRRT